MTTTGSNSNHNHHEDGSAKNNNTNNNNNNPSTRSWGTAVSGQSVSTSGSMGSPSSRSEQTTTVATSASDSAFLRLNNLDIQGDDAGSQGASGGKKKKRGQRAAGPDKSGRGLRQFSMKVCEKVESKGRTTYNEVADELVAEFALPNNDGTSPDQQQYDEKNIRRRVYDALNVLMAMDIISKDKKEIQWRGLPRTSLSDIEELKNERLSLRNRIDKKTAYSQELEEQYIGLQNLIQRNEHLYSSGNAPSGGVALPFILVQTRPHATVEVEISEDMQLVHFDFNSTPFELHDDNFVLKTMKFCDQPPQTNGHNNSQISSHNFAPNIPNEGPSTGSALQPDVYQSHHPHPLQHQLHSQPQITPTPETNNIVSASDTAPGTLPQVPGIMQNSVKPEN
ncbi:Transcription factor-like protein DPB [Cardamine amara subsp. amara]|uniref:Transcription factor-like protein DPB n=1 Tax=Cardamine amara subsp. amara TaxID=228776 RepID=A0ABD0ZPV0_CARAN